MNLKQSYSESDNSEEKDFFLEVADNETDSPFEGKPFILRLKSTTLEDDIKRASKKSNVRKISQDTFKKISSPIVLPLESNSDTKKVLLDELKHTNSLSASQKVNQVNCRAHSIIEEDHA